MKKFMTIFIAMFLLFGCTNIKKVSQNQERYIADDIASINYNISTLTYSEENKAIRVEYPQVDGRFESLDNLNNLIKQKLKEQLEIISEDNFCDLDMKIAFNTTFKNNNLVCFLFEGKVYRDGAAHPINVGFSICISLKETKIVSPKSFLAVENILVEEFLSQVKKQPADNRFSEDEWSQVVEYIKRYSNAEILQMLQSEECVFSLKKDGIVILFPVPHVIGDYLKIFVPYSWENSNI